MTLNRPIGRMMAIYFQPSGETINAIASPNRNFGRWNPKVYASCGVVKVIHPRARRIQARETPMITARNPPGSDSGHFTREA